MIGYELSFYQNMFHLDLRSDLNLATARLSVNTLDQAGLRIISTLIILLNVTAGQNALDNFNQDQINTMIVHLSTV